MRGIIEVLRPVILFLFSFCILVMCSGDCSFSRLLLYVTFGQYCTHSACFATSVFMCKSVRFQNLSAIFSLFVSILLVSIPSIHPSNDYYRTPTSIFGYQYMFLFTSFTLHIPTVCTKVNSISISRIWYFLRFVLLACRYRYERVFRVQFVQWSIVEHHLGIQQLGYILCDRVGEKVCPTRTRLLYYPEVSLWHSEV